MSIQQHDITYFELDFPNLKNITPKCPNLGQPDIYYLLLGSLFIDDELFGLVKVKNSGDKANYYTTCLVRIYLINMRTKKHNGYIEYLDSGSINLYGRIIIHRTMYVVSPSLPKKSTYTIYAITNSLELKKIKEFVLPNCISYVCHNNTFLYLDAKNNFAGFRYFPSTDSIEDLYAENMLITGTGTAQPSTQIIQSQLPFLIYSTAKDNKYIILEYSRYDIDDNGYTKEGDQMCYLFDMQEWPPKFIKDYCMRDIMPYFNKNYFNNYISQEHQPITFLNVFPELLHGILDENINDVVLDFKQVKRYDTTEPNNTRLTYEIVVVGDLLAGAMDAEHRPRLPICGYDINSNPQMINIINTHLGSGRICGTDIFELVEDKYRKTLTRHRVAKEYFTSSGLDKFIHPFGRLIYSQSGKDGILELNHNRTKYKNIIQGFYIFVLLCNKPNIGTGEQSYRIKVIGYYPQRVGEIKQCQVSDDEFVYHTKFYDREQTQTASLTLFYSSFVRRMRARFDKALLGYQPDLIIDNISRFYVSNKYREDIGLINSRNDLVPLLGL
jgi:hypothetical protein